MQMKMPNERIHIPVGIDRLKNSSLPMLGIGERGVELVRVVEVESWRLYVGLTFGFVVVVDEVCVWMTSHPRNQHPPHLVMSYQHHRHQQQLSHLVLVEM